MRSLLIVALWCGLASAKPVWRPPIVPRPDVNELAARLAEAIRTRDIAGVQAMLADPLVHDGLWFADARCAKRFGKQGTIEKHDVRALAKCLVQQKLIATTRRSGAAGGAILTFAPGIEIQLVFKADRVTYAGALWPSDADRGKPTLTVQALEALRTAGTTQLDAALAGKLTGTASAWIKVCLDPSGAIASTVVAESKPAAAGDVFLAAIRDWSFKPFANGRAACGLTLLTYPAASAAAVEVVPASPALPRNDRITVDDELLDLLDHQPTSVGSLQPNVPSSLLEQQRRKGTRQIDPDATTKVAIARAGLVRVTAAMKLCVDAAGKVASVTQLKSSGFADYDLKLAREMRAWAFKPYLVRSKPTAVCTVFTTIYRKP